jgi:hypothetical protein
MKTANEQSSFLAVFAGCAKEPTVAKQAEIDLSVEAHCLGSRIDRCESICQVFIFRNLAKRARANLYYELIPNYAIIITGILQQPKKKDGAIKKCANELI